MHELHLKVNGLLYGGWEAVRVDRGMDQISGMFDLQVSELWPDQAQEVRIDAGDTCQLLVDGLPVITGYVDDVVVAHNGRQHVVSVIGRDKTGDLVDCSAIHKTGQWRQRRLEQIAAELCQPFGVQVVVAPGLDTGRPFATFALQEGETVFETLERMARIRGVLLASDGQGRLLVTRSGHERVATPLVLGHNILEARGGISLRDRYSHYVVKSQAPGTDFSSGPAVSQIKAKATDPSVKRYRPLVMVSESQGDGLSLRDRANWEATVRAARATEIFVTLQGWSHANGLWEPNTLVKVQDRWMRLDDGVELLIRAVSFKLDDRAGATTELSLTRADAFKLLPQKEPGAGRGSWWDEKSKGVGQ